MSLLLNDLLEKRRFQINSSIKNTFLHPREGAGSGMLFQSAQDWGGVQFFLGLRSCLKSPPKASVPCIIVLIARFKLSLREIGGKMATVGFEISLRQKCQV